MQIFTALVSCLLYSQGEQESLFLIQRTKLGRMRNTNINEMKNVSLFSAFLTQGKNLVNTEVRKTLAELMKSEIWVFISNYNKA